MSIITVDEFLERLEHLQNDAKITLKKRVSEKITEQSVEKLVEKIPARTGDLRRSIGTEATDLGSYIKTSSPYYRYVQRSQGRDYADEVINESKEEILADAGEEVLEWLRETFR